MTDTRDRERHLQDAVVLLLQDAVVLLAAIEDPFAERDQFAGSDWPRVQRLANHLPADAREWRRLPPRSRTAAQAALRVFCS